MRISNANSRICTLIPLSGRSSNHLNATFSISDNSFGRGSGLGLDGTSNDALALLLSGAGFLYLGRFAGPGVDKEPKGFFLLDAFGTSAP